MARRGRKVTTGRSNNKSSRTYVSRGTTKKITAFFSSQGNRSGQVNEGDNVQDVEQVTIF